MKIGIFLILCTAAGMARGQRVLTRQQWDAVEGLYGLKSNKNMFIRFTDRDGELVARFLWDATAEVHFLPDSGLVFDRSDEGEGGQVHIRFRKDEQGRVVHVTMGNGTEWDRWMGVTVSPEQLKVLAGIYQSLDDTDNRVKIMAGDTSLVVKQAWDGREAVVVPLSETFFYAPDQFYTLLVLPPEILKPRAVRLMSRYTFQLIGR
jgi:hypothetical protein